MRGRGRRGYKLKSWLVLMQNGDFVALVEAGIDLLFERSWFLIATCKKKKLTVCVCVCSANLGFSAEKLSWFYCRVPASAWLILVWKN